MKNRLLIVLLALCVGTAVKADGGGDYVDMSFSDRCLISSDSELLP